MADVNWHQYNCNLCLAVGLTAAAVASGVITAILAQAGLSVILLVILFLVVWGVLFKLVDGFCASRYAESSHGAEVGAAGAVAPIPATGSSDEDLTAKAGEEAAAEAEAAEELAVAQQAEAEAKAAAEQAAAEVKAAKEQAAAEAKAAAEQAAEEKATAEAKMAAESAAAAEAEAAAKEAAERAAEAERAKAAGEADYDGDGVVEGKFEGSRPEALDGPRGGVADDLKRIKGVGPKMEILCNSLGFYHFDQIASWEPDEIAWVDANLEGFKGRVTRDEWVAQAKLLASGEETEFSKRVDEGDVPSSQ